MPKSFRPDHLLVLGAIIGVLGVLFGLIERNEENDAVYAEVGWAAEVNGRPIAIDKFWATLARLTAEERGPRPDAALREKILNRLIHEELLFDRAMSLGLAQREPIVRRRLIEAVGKSVAENAERTQPDDATLREFFDKRPELFSVSDRFLTKVLYYRGLDDTARRRADAAYAKLNEGLPFESVAADADRPIAPIPNGYLSEADLKRHLGPTLAASIARLSPGETGVPVKSAGGYWLAQLSRRKKGPQLKFESMRDAVASQWRRQREKEALEKHVAMLARNAEVRVNRSLLNPDYAIPDEYLQDAKAK